MIFLIGCKKNDDAISEVVSTILLVAITVLLAAIIVAFVMGMTGNMQKGKIATSTISRVNGSYVTVTFVGGQNGKSVVGFNWTVNGGAPATWISGSSVTAGIQDHPSSGGILPWVQTRCSLHRTPERTGFSASLSSRMDRSRSSSTRLSDF